MFEMQAELETLGRHLFVAPGHPSLHFRYKVGKTTAATALHLSFTVVGQLLFANSHTWAPPVPDGMSSSRTRCG